LANEIFYRFRKLISPRIVSKVISLLSKSSVTVFCHQEPQKLYHDYEKVSALKVRISEVHFCHGGSKIKLSALIPFPLWMQDTDV
jgi:hypothetical protein